MPTIKQKKLAKAIVENLESKHTKTAGELLESAGYGTGTAEGSPGRTIEQKGVQEELVNLGFTEQNAKNVVSKLMLDDTQDGNVRLKAADMTFKVHGSYAPEKHEVASETTVSFIPEVLAIAEEELRKRKVDAK